MFFKELTLAIEIASVAQNYIIIAIFFSSQYRELKCLVCNGPNGDLIVTLGHPQNFLPGEGKQISDEGVGDKNNLLPLKTPENTIFFSKK